MALFSGLQTPAPFDAEAAASRGAGNLGQGLLQIASMMQGQKNLEASKLDAAKQNALNQVVQKDADAKVGMVGMEIEQIRNNPKLAPEEVTLGVMDVFRRNGSLFNDPMTRQGIMSLAQNEALNEKTLEGFEKAKIATIQKQTQQALLKEQIEMASKLAKSGPEGAKAASSLFVADANGNMPVSDVANFNTISELYGQFTPASSGGVEISQIEVGGKPFAIFQVPGSKAFQIKDLGALSAVDMATYRDTLRRVGDAKAALADPIKGRIGAAEYNKIIADGEKTLKRIMGTADAAPTPATPTNAPAKIGRFTITPQ